ncbi:hypothetical protein M2284_001752 [Rhodococcus sp. LBL1]|nr:hypothetical protein [Rhodococcus sp. LBL1]MDH6683140.1 hypothetical protein [Rhodococcus sp. LBL2]
MATITDHYGMSGPVPFCDVDVDIDSRLFLDACAVRMTAGPEPYRSEALTALETFFQAVARAVMSGDPATRARGRVLLQRFVEPWETRFGLAAAGFRGHGGADDVGSVIWDALVNDLVALMGVGVLSRVEHLPLFVEGVGDDITSDITTRLMFSALAGFTREVVAQYPEFTAGSHTTELIERQVWDPVGLDWSIELMELPMVNGEPLLLVPTEWARKNLLMSSVRFYEKSVLDFVQAEGAVLLSGDRLHKTPKGVLRANPGAGPGVHTNRAVALRAQQADTDLVEMYEGHVRRRLSAEGRKLIA